MTLPELGFLVSRFMNTAPFYISLPVFLCLFLLALSLTVFVSWLLSLLASKTLSQQK